MIDKVIKYLTELKNIKIYEARLIRDSGYPSACKRINVLTKEIKEIDEIIEVIE